MQENTTPVEMVDQLQAGHFVRHRRRGRADWNYGWVDTTDTDSHLGSYASVHRVVGPEDVPTVLRFCDSEYDRDLGTHELQIVPRSMVRGKRIAYLDIEIV